MRIANVIRQLNDEQGYNFTLVLPPWHGIWHWRNSNLRIPWRELFDIKSLNKFISVIEFDEFIKDKKELTIDSILYLQHYQEGWSEDKGFEIKYDIRPCIDANKYYYKKYGEIWEGDFSELNCLSIQGQSSTLVDAIIKLLPNKQTILIDRAETILHDIFGDINYWKARKSMNYSKKLKNIGDLFRKQKFPPLGSEFICAHLRRGDFLKDLSTSLGIKNIFICTDSINKEFNELKLILNKNGLIVERFVSEEHSPAAISIIDQWICANARYFIGTHHSTFSLRINEDREILGHLPETTFNRFCGEKEENDNLKNNADLPFTEDIYRAYSAIINSLLLNHLDFSQKNFFNTKKIACLILQFDSIILKSTQLEINNSKTFKLLDYLIKCIFYMRIGDFIFATIFAEKTISKKSSKQLILAIYSYNIAYEYIIKGIELDENIDLNLYSILSFCALELNILLKKNCFDENALFLCNNLMLGSFIYNFSETFNLQKENNENKLFIFSDQTTITNQLRTNFDIKKYLKNSFSLIENNYFLRRFVWIISEISDDFKEKIYTFIDQFFNFLPDCPIDEFNSCSPESISKIDLKIFLFRLSHYLNCEFNNKQINCTPPWIFYKKPNSNHLKFWNFIVKSLNDGGISENFSTSLILDDLNNIIEITTIIEQIRDPNIQTNSDDLINTIKFINQLILKNTKNKNEKFKNYLKILLERYSNIFKLIIPENDWIFIVDENKIEIEEENNFIKEIKGGGEKEKEEKEEEILIKEKEHLTMSTQTEETIKEHPVDQHTSKQQKIVYDWGETNFHINRWIYHNEALYKIAFPL
ncbi:hypothetical protein Mgra_00004165 [Meloidogyne graminicola]|uniref:GDP-fucose protein O-fucosyltransferase 2 n=1 Tax=Meloidogyne graminicola TaxID=189291 RepID=A0A8S9ZTB4_9BILA|nr:hypothetical protein Mgra_00004165 [Meloidogyne graminicola]